MSEHTRDGAIRACNGRPFSEDDESRLDELRAAGMSDVAIGREMSRHPSVIRAQRKKRELEPGISRAAKAIIARLNLRHRVIAA